MCQGNATNSVRQQTRQENRCQTPLLPQRQHCWLKATSGQQQGQPRAGTLPCMSMAKIRSEAGGKFPPGSEAAFQTNPVVLSALWQPDPTSCCWRDTRRTCLGCSLTCTLLCCTSSQFGSPGWRASLADLSLWKGPKQPEVTKGRSPITTPTGEQLHRAEHIHLCQGAHEREKAHGEDTDVCTRLGCGAAPLPAAASWLEDPSPTEKICFLRAKRIKTSHMASPAGSHQDALLPRGSRVGDAQCSPRAISVAKGTANTTVTVPPRSQHLNKGVSA